MTVDKITSTRNPLICELRSLKDKRVREQTNLFLVEGEKMLLEALKCGLRPRILLSVSAKLDGISRVFEDTGTRIYEVPENVLASVCDTVTPQGCACSFMIPDPLGDDVTQWPKLIVALDGVQDPGNAGTIWRTADAAGFGAIIAGADCADLLSPKVQRSAMGSGFRVPYRREDDLAGLLDDLRKADYDVIVSSLDGEAFYRREKVSKKFVLVIGSEARGVCQSVSLRATKRLKLPMRGGAESLNAAVAAGIMMYELTKDLESV